MKLQVIATRGHYVSCQQIQRDSSSSFKKRQGWQRKEEGVSLQIYLLVPFIIMGLSHSVFTPVPQHFILDVLKTFQYRKSKFQHNFLHFPPSPKKTTSSFSSSPPCFSISVKCIFILQPLILRRLIPVPSLSFLHPRCHQSQITL